MKLFGWNISFGRSGASQAAGTNAGEKSPSFMHLRRFEAADTDRLNKERWKGAVVGQSINADLSQSLETIRARVQYEVANNPLLEGIIHTYATDVVGENGPGLQINTPDTEYNDALEAVCADVFDDIDADGSGALADLLKLFIRSFWDSGECLGQIVTDPDATTPVKIRVKPLGTRRLATPPELLASSDWCLGVKRNQLGRHLAYAISRVQLMGTAELYTGGYDPIPAKDIIHGYQKLEAGQVRGVPWLSTPLSSQAELRDYDAQVLDAARNAATWAVSLYTEHDDAEYVNIPGTADIERGQYQTVPPGWKPMALTPPQPATNYKDYRDERQREAGRPIGMPLMMVKLDSSKHNYSSARFDAQPYRRGITAFRGWIRRRILVRLVDLIAREAELYAIANPRWEYAALRRRPARLSRMLRWTWQAFPHVDDEKEANGQRMRMEDGTLTFSDACLENGQDPDAVLAQLDKDAKKLEAIGITPPWKRQDRSAPLPASTDEIAAQAKKAQDEAAAEAAAATATTAARK